MKQQGRSLHIHILSCTLSCLILTLALVLVSAVDAMPTNLEAPIAVDDVGYGYITNEDEPITTLNLLGNDLDPDGDIMFVESINMSDTLGEVTLINPYAEGSLDPSFDSDGYVTSDFGTNTDFIESVELQDDGKIITVGASTYDFSLARYNSNGSLDTSFSMDGKVTTDFYGNYDTGKAVVIQPDGKIIVAGTTKNISATAIALARYNSDGSLDSSFGVGGIQIANFDNITEGEDIALQPDGKIVVIGTYDRWQFAVARYNPNGTLDTSFDGDGKLLTLFHPVQVNGKGVVILPDGKILVGGDARDYDQGYDFVMARYNPDGSLDTTFDGDGKVITDFGSEGWALFITLQPDNKIVMSGIVDGDVGLIRYNPDGTLDSTFDGDGKVTTDFGSTYDVGYEVAIQSDGKIIVAGVMGYMPTRDFILSRYNSDGSLDNSFDGDGKVISDFGYDEEAHAVALQSDGQIILAGGTNISDPYYFNYAIARYNIGGSLAYDPNGQFEWLAAGEQVFDTLTYVVSDGILTDTATVSITINGVNDTPVVEAGDNQSVTEGQTINFAGNFIDPDWAAGTIMWDFGDGFTAAGTLIPAHVYRDNGIYSVSLTVVDYEGAAGSDSLMVIASNVAPTVNDLADITTLEGHQFTLAGTITDPGLLDTHQVFIDWLPNETQTIDLAVGVFAFSTSYTFYEPGLYEVWVTVVDNDDGETSQHIMVSVMEAWTIYLPVITK